MCGETAIEPASTGRGGRFEMTVLSSGVGAVEARRDDLLATGNLWRTESGGRTGADGIGRNFGSANASVALLP